MNEPSMSMHNHPHLDTMYCQVCNGTGKVYQEHADGSLSEHVCPYCQGTQNSTWVRQKFDARNSRMDTVRWVIVGYFGALFLTNGLTFWNTNALELGGKYGWFFLIHCIAWAIGIAGAVWWLVHPRPSKRRQRKLARGPRHDPMTTDKERLMGAVVLGGAAVKTAWEQQRRYR